MNLAEKTEKPAVADKSGIIGNALSLYPGDHAEKTFNGTTAIGGYFTVSGGVPAMKDSYSIDLADDITLEKDNISFRLYKNEGFESLGIVRGWMNNAACGTNGEYIADPAEGPGMQWRHARAGRQVRPQYQGCRDPVPDQNGTCARWRRRCADMERNFRNKLKGETK